MLFTNMGSSELRYVIPIAKELRLAGIPVEIYPDNVKLKKQFDYADKKGIKFLAIVGENEVNKGVVTLKDLATGEQVEMTPSELAGKIK